MMFTILSHRQRLLFQSGSCPHSQYAPEHVKDGMGMDILTDLLQRRVGRDEEDVVDVVAAQIQQKLEIPMELCDVYWCDRCLREL